MSCSWKPVNSTVGVMNVDLYTPNRLETVMFHIQVFYKYLIGGYKPFLIDTVQDLCAFSKQGNNLIQLGEMITRNIQEYLFNIQCPIEVGRNTLIHFIPILINCFYFPGPTWDQGSSRESG